jgi:hypothetical protein
LVDKPLVLRCTAEASSALPGGAVENLQHRDRIKVAEDQNGLSGRFVVSGAVRATSVAYATVPEPAARPG